MCAFLEAAIRLGRKRRAAQYKKFKERLHRMHKAESFYSDLAKAHSLGRMGRRKGFHVGMVT